MLREALSAELGQPRQPHPEFFQTVIILDRPYAAVTAPESAVGEVG